MLLRDFATHLRTLQNFIIRNAKLDAIIRMLHAERDILDAAGAYEERHGRVGGEVRTSHAGRLLQPELHTP